MNSIEIPSFTQKLSWAERRLEELEDSVAEFQARHPYRSRRADERSGQPWVLEFTEPVNREWALMIGEVLYNLRSALEYLAGALNPRSRRYLVTFPCVKEPVWEIPHEEGESESRTRARTTWETSTWHMREEAITIMKHLQPTVDCYPYFHCLDLLNRLSNKDRHRDLLVNFTGLTNIRVRFITRDGEVYGVDAEPDVPKGQPGTAALSHGAKILLPPELHPDEVEHVDITGLTTQAIPMGDTQEPGVVVPDMLRQILDWIRKEAVVPLSPYISDR